MFTKFKGIFSSKQSSGETNEYLGSRREKEMFQLLIGQLSPVSGWVMSPENLGRFKYQNVIFEKRVFASVIPG